MDDDYEDEPLECFDPESHCPRCSIDGYTCVHHGVGSWCDRDPEYVVNVIAQYFKDRQTDYVGIIWEAVANNVMRALGWHNGERVTIDEMGRVVHNSKDFGENG